MIGEWTRRDIGFIVTGGGDVYSIGSNKCGQLGIGNTEDQTSPVQIAGLSNIEDVYTDGYSVIAKDTSGNLYAWGGNYEGQLGIGSTEEYQTSPVKIEGLSNIEEVYTGEGNVIAKDTSGNLYAWGANWSGQLGIGSTENQTSPVQISGLSNIEEVYTSDDSVIAKDASGNLYAWGNNYSGQLEIGSTEEYQTSPVQISGLSNIEEVYFYYNKNNFTYNYVIAKDTSGNLYAWGNNYSGQLGIGNTENQTSPVQISGLSNIEEVYTSEESVIAKDANGDLYAWGANWGGKLGIGNTEDQTSPVKISGLNNVEDVYNGEYSVVVKDASGNLYVWGRNAKKELGIGSTGDQTIPLCLNQQEGSLLYNKQVQNIISLYSDGYKLYYIITETGDYYLYEIYDSGYIE